MGFVMMAIIGTLGCILGWILAGFYYRKKMKSLEEKNFYLPGRYLR